MTKNNTTTTSKDALGTRGEGNNNSEEAPSRRKKRSRRRRGGGQGDVSVSRMMMLGALVALVVMFQHQQQISSSSTIFVHAGFATTTRTARTDRSAAVTSNNKATAAVLRPFSGGAFSSSSFITSNYGGWMMRMARSSNKNSGAAATTSHLQMSTTEQQQKETAEQKQQEGEEEVLSLTTDDEEVLFGGTAFNGNTNGAVNGGSTTTTTTRTNGSTTTKKNAGRQTSMVRPTSSSSSSTRSIINPLDISTKNPLLNELAKMRNELRTCPELWLRLAKLCPTERAVYDAHLCDNETIDMTFQQMHSTVQKTAVAFQTIIQQQQQQQGKSGTTQQKNIAIFSENSARWLMIDHGIQSAGYASAVRGADAPIDELRYIYQHSDSAGVVVLQGPKLLKKLMKTPVSDEEDGNASRNSSPLGLHNEAYGNVKHVVLINREKTADDEIQKLEKELGTHLTFYTDMIEAVENIDIEDNMISSLSLNGDDPRERVATIVYTSGTTGRPKGVMLTHGNLLHQTRLRLSSADPIDVGTEPEPGHCTVSILPVWHITERTFELWMFTHGCSVIYSNIRHFKNDLAKHQPQWLVLVPRVLEKIATGVNDKFNSGSIVVQTLAKLFTTTGNIANVNRKIINDLVVVDNDDDISGSHTTTTAKRGILGKFKSIATVAALAPFNAIGNVLVWKKVRNGFGGNLKAIICGGSALAGNLEVFYETAGISICVGYGLTECSPIISYRRSNENLSIAGCAGKACLETELRIVDQTTTTTSTISSNGDRSAVVGPRQSIKDGDIGVIIAKGPQIMKGYYKNEKATNEAIDEYGWFNTGDLGRINPTTGDLILTGRAKDTIVLSNGENIEPQPIEDAMIGYSNLIEQVMLTGQDGRRLVAICVLNPTELVNAGYNIIKDMKSLQDANEKINNPKCTQEEYIAASALLNDTKQKLISNSSSTWTSLLKTIKNDVRSATSSSGNSFRSWEQVKDVVITLEPFAMINGQLTQSYKVKRDAVYKRYQNEI